MFELGAYATLERMELPSQHGRERELLAAAHSAGNRDLCDWGMFDRGVRACDERGVDSGTSCTSIQTSALAPAPAANVRMETTRTCVIGHMLFRFFPTAVLCATGLVPHGYRQGPRGNFVLLRCPTIFLRVLGF